MVEAVADVMRVSRNASSRRSCTGIGMLRRSATEAAMPVIYQTHANSACLSSRVEISLIRNPGADGNFSAHGMRIFGPAFSGL